MGLDQSRIDYAAARHIDTAANIASGRGEYALANRLWAFASRLRREAAERKGT